MSVEQGFQSTTTIQRNCRGTRHKRCRFSTEVSDSSRDVTLGQSPYIQSRVQFSQIAKRKSHDARLCATYCKRMQPSNVRLDIMSRDEAGHSGSPRLSPEQRPQTSTHNVWESMRSAFSNYSSPNNSATESELGNIPPNPSTGGLNSPIFTDLPPVTSNVVSISATEFSNTLESVANIDDQSHQCTHIVSTYERQESFNADQNHDRPFEKLSASFSEEIDRFSSAGIRSHRLSMLAKIQPTLEARQVANRVIRHARSNKIPDERSLWCPDCRCLPTLPVTGQCGHTRCTKCIQLNGACPCGIPAPKNLHINTLIQSMIKKILTAETCLRGLENNNGRNQIGYFCGPPRTSTTVHCRARCHGRRASGGRAHPSQPREISCAHTLMPLQARFALAQRLACSGRHRDAAPHFARVAACRGPLARSARLLLAQSITVLSGGLDARRVLRALLVRVRAQSAGAWVAARELECALCYHAYRSPVTTPCGHVYCRTCVERCMDYRKTCALCLRSLDDFHLAATGDTAFVTAALESIDAVSLPPPAEPDVIPIFVCTVAYPAIPCPLFIFDPRYWLMIRRVLESGSRKFGMVAYERDRTYSDYGTVLEVRDCVHLQDGRSILSTIGVSRFRVIERDVRDGCDVARIEPFTDIAPTEELVIWELRIIATQISYKAILWLNGMTRRVRSEIEAAFGHLPHFNHRQENWWDSPDGPAWLWWLIAILPLRSEIKILILSTKSLLKRMMAVSRTLEAIDQVSLSAAAAASSECELRSALSNAQEWLERSA